MIPLLLGIIILLLLLLAAAFSLHVFRKPAFLFEWLERWRKGETEQQEAWEQNEQKMLTGVSNLDKTLVHEIMTPRVDIVAVSQTATIAEARAAIARSGHSRIPVYDKSVDTITGILYAKDFLDEEAVRALTSLQALVHQPVFIPESKNVAELLTELREKHVHLAIVLDEYGGTAGLVTIEDILEEIVGEIQDEYDHEEQAASNGRLAKDGSLLTEARIPIYEVNQALGTELSEEEGYDTIGGYIMAELGRIPKSGEHVETDLLSFDILSASPRRIHKVRIQRRKVSETLS